MKNIFKLFCVSICFFLHSSHIYAQNNLRFEIHGVEGEALKNITSRLSIEQKTYGDKLSIENIYTIIKHAPQEIKLAIQPYGFFHPILKHKLIHHQSYWVAIFTIQLGPPLIIKNIDLKISGVGNKNIQFKKIKNKFPMKVGDVFKTGSYNNAKENLFLIANNQGYIHAFFATNKIMINIKTNQVNIIFHFNTGPRYYFGRVYFSESPYATAFLHHFIYFKKNEPFSIQKLTHIQQAMSSSFYFRRVNIIPEFQKAVDQHIPIYVDLDVQKAQKYNFGIGYGTFTGPRLTAGANFRHITKTGQHADTQLRLSSVLTIFGVKYYFPGRNPITDRWLLGANYQKFYPKQGKSTAKSFLAGFIRKFNKWSFNPAINYLIETYFIKNSPTRTNGLLYPSLNISYVKTDNLINPQFGKSINFNLQGAVTEIFSSTTFLQTNIESKYIFSPTKFSRVILRGEFGYTLIRELEGLPLTMRFFAGGVNSIRGYADSSIGPGKYLLIGSLEYQNRVYRDWYGAVFYDLGIASNHFKGYKKSVGIGGVYQSIMGPIKLYVVKPLSEKHKRNLGLEFNIGPEL
jgi:translocation and assembly module TamA